MDRGNVDSPTTQASMVAEPADPQTGLTGRLGTWDLVLATLAFAGPLTGTTGYLTVMISSGSGVATPLAFLGVMGVLLVFAVAYGAMTRYVPKAGAFYAYITAGLGKEVGLGASFLILMSYLSIGVGFYGFAGLMTRQFVVSRGGPDLPWWAFSFVFWLVVAVLGYFHVEISAKILGVLLVAELVVVLAFDAVILLAGGEEGTSMRSFDPAELPLETLGYTFIFAVALFSGFEGTAIYREETKDPDRTIPRATILVVCFIGLFYALTSWALITALGTSQAVERSTTEGAAVFDTVAGKFLGTVFVDVTAVLVVTSILAAHLAIQNVATRYTYSLAVDGIFPQFLGKAHPKHKSPYRSSLCMSAVYFIATAVLITIGLTSVEIYTWFAGIASFTIICAMALTSLAAIVFFRRNKTTGLGVWKATIAPVLAFLALSVMVYLGVTNLPVLIGGSQGLANAMVALAVGIFIFGIVLARRLRHTAPEVYARIGRQ